MNIRFTALLLFFLLSAYSVFADEPRIFTNSDLDKYLPVGNSLKEEPQSSSGGNELQSRSEPADRDLADQKKWCDMATRADARIKEAETALSESAAARAKMWRRLMLGNRYDATEVDRAARNELEGAETELNQAKQEKLNLEDSAHRSGIPPGWLRCQF